MTKSSSLPVVIGLVVAACILTTMTVVQVVSAAAGEGLQPGYSQLSQDELAGMPDPDNNRDDELEMSCTACHAAYRNEVVPRFQKVTEEFQRIPEKRKSYHYLAAVDGVCKTSFMHIGLLQLDSKSVTRRFMHEKEAREQGGFSVLKGGWLTSFYTQRCWDMMTELEDNIDEILSGEIKDVKPVLCKTCIDWEKREKQLQEKAEKKKNRKKKKKSTEGDL